MNEFHSQLLSFGELSCFPEWLMCMKGLCFSMRNQTVFVLVLVALFNGGYTHYMCEAKKGLHLFFPHFFNSQFLLSLVFLDNLVIYQKTERGGFTVILCFLLFSESTEYPLPGADRLHSSRSPPQEVWHGKCSVSVMCGCQFAGQRALNRFTA